MTRAPWGRAFCVDEMSAACTGMGARRWAGHEALSSAPLVRPAYLCDEQLAAERRWQRGAEYSASGAADVAHGPTLIPGTYRVSWFRLRVLWMQ